MRLHPALRAPEPDGAEAELAGGPGLDPPVQLGERGAVVGVDQVRRRAPQHLGAVLRLDMPSPARLISSSRPSGPVSVTHSGSLSRMVRSRASLARRASSARLRPVRSWTWAMKWSGRPSGARTSDSEARAQTRCPSRCR